MIYLLLQYVVAIGGMTAVGFIVWRLLQRQEAREKKAGSDADGSGMDSDPRSQNEDRGR